MSIFSSCFHLTYHRIILVDILAIFFGISSWISINGLWVELPLLVESLPEGWALPSYLSIIVQLANIGPITYGLMRGFCKDSIPQHLIITSLLVVGAIASLLLALLWDKTWEIGGQTHSGGLFLLVFFLSLVDCTSSVLFLPYMAVFKGIYLYSYFIGEGMSGFVPSIAALLQGVSGNPVCQNVTLANGTVVVKPVTGEARFSTDTFFYFLLSMMLLSLVSFLLLHHLPTARREHSSKTALLTAIPPPHSHHGSTGASSNGGGGGGTSLGVRKMSTTSSDESFPVDETFERTIDIDNDNCSGGGSNNIILLLAIQCFVCFLSNGALPSIQSFSCLPYGNNVYHLAVTLNAMANPTMAFLAMFFPCNRQDLIALLTLIGAAMAGYIMATALYSPAMISTQAVGGTLVVLTWVALGALFSYVKVCIAGICRESEKLFWCGAVTQLGSALGALLMFILVNQVNLFQGYYVQC